MARVVHREGPHGDILVELDGKVRIETGLPFVETVATPEILHNDVTHPDYTVGPVPARTMGGEPIFDESGAQKLAPAVDAKGQVIEHGKPFAYIDFYAPKKHAAGLREHPHNFKVYRLEDDETNREHKWVGGRTPEEILKSRGVSQDVIEANPVLKEMVPPDGMHVEDPDHPHHLKRWIKHAEFETMEEAEALAAKLLAGG